MKYFTAEEARGIINHGDISLCTGGDLNPAKEAAQVLFDTAERRHDSPWTAAVCGFVLGRATGIREDRQRRKEALGSAGPLDKLREERPA